MHNIFHLNREFPHFPWFKCNEIWAHYQEGAYSAEYKKMSYWQNCDSCYEEISLKKMRKKNEKNKIYIIYIFFLKSLFYM